MEYITAREAAKKWSVSERLVQQYCISGRIEGAKKFGVSWAIPENDEKPAYPHKHGRTGGGGNDNRSDK